MYKIAVIPCDGIGTEVINSGVEVLKALSKSVQNLPVEFHQFDWGAEYYKKHGVMMPDEGVEELKSFNAIYFGSAGVPEIPDHITLWGLRLKICQGLDQYANLRPVRLLPGITSPLKNVDENIIVSKIYMFSNRVDEKVFHPNIINHHDYDNKVLCFPY